MAGQRQTAAELEAATYEEYLVFHRLFSIDSDHRLPRHCAARHCINQTADIGRLNPYNFGNNQLYFCLAHRVEARRLYNTHKHIEPIIFIRDDFRAMLLHPRDESPTPRVVSEFWRTIPLSSHCRLIFHLRSRTTINERRQLLREALWQYFPNMHLKCTQASKIPVVQALRFAADARDAFQGFIKLGLADYNHTILPTRLRTLAARIQFDR